MSSSSDTDEYSEYDDCDLDEGSPENHFKILSTSVPLNFCLMMNPERIRAIRITETRCALARGHKKLSILVKVVSSNDCPVDSVIVPKLVQFSLDVSIHDSLCVLPFDGKMQADALQIVPLFDPGLTDYSKLLSEFFSADFRPVSVGSAFGIYSNDSVLNFRVINILPTDRCIAWKKTRIVLIKPREAPTNATLLGRHFSDLALSLDVLDQINKYIQLPVQHPALLKSLGVRTSNGVLICGGKGAGKTTLLTAISRESKVPYLFVKVPDLMALQQEQAMERLKLSFKNVLDRAPALLLLDDIHAMTRTFRSNVLVDEKRFAALFASLLDRWLSEPGIVVVATAYHPDDVDPSLRRLGRFAFEVSLPDPLPAQRIEIVKLNTIGMNIEPDDIVKISGKTTARKSCADVAEIVEVAINRMIRNNLKSTSRFVTDAEIFESARNRVKLTDLPVTIVENETEGEEEKPESDLTDELSMFAVGKQKPQKEEPKRKPAGGGDIFDVAQTTIKPVDKTSDPFALPAVSVKKDIFAENPASAEQHKPKDDMDIFGMPSNKSASSGGRTPVAKPGEGVFPVKSPPVQQTPKKAAEVFRTNVETDKGAQTQKQTDVFQKGSGPRPDDETPLTVAQKAPSDPFAPVPQQAKPNVPSTNVNPFVTQVPQQKVSNQPAQQPLPPNASPFTAKPTQQQEVIQPVQNVFTPAPSNPPPVDPFAMAAEQVSAPQNATQKIFGHTNDPFAPGAVSAQPIQQNDPFVNTGFGQTQFGNGTFAAAPPQAPAQQQPPVETPVVIGSVMLGGGGLRDMFAGPGPSQPEQPALQPVDESKMMDLIAPVLSPEQAQKAAQKPGNVTAMDAVMGVTHPKPSPPVQQTPPATTNFGNAPTMPQYGFTNPPGGYAYQQDPFNQPVGQYQPPYGNPDPFNPGFNNYNQAFPYQQQPPQPKKQVDIFADFNPLK